jgi:hypothetical protein
MAAKEAEAMPFPKEETTPPVTKMKRVMKYPMSYMTCHTSIGIKTRQNNHTNTLQLGRTSVHFLASGWKCLTFINF